MNGLCIRGALRLPGDAARRSKDNLLKSGGPRKNTYITDVNSKLPPAVQTVLSNPEWGFTVKGKMMTVARITEISSVSNESFQDAIVQGVERANKTLKNVKGAWVKDQEVTIDNGKVTGYKVILKVTFILAD